MAKKFNIHDWHYKNRLNEQEDPGKSSKHDYKGLAAEVAKYVGGRFATWMSPDNPPFSQEYANAPYFDKLIDGIMDTINDYKGEEELDEMNTTGGGASFNAGNGEGYATPNAFKKKPKED